MINGRFRLRGGTAAQATAANVILRARELALETDTGLFKVGDGVTAWNTLPYGGVRGLPGQDGRGIVSVARTSGTGAAGTTDTYTITYSTGPVSTFTLTNGANGTNGQSVAMQDEGSTLTSAASGINFVGQLVTATVSGSQVTVTVATPTSAQVGAIPAAEKGAANGVTPLGADSKIPAIYLPGFVDDVLEFANLAAFPTTGESGKLFVAIDTGKTYRWSGSAYIEISASPGSTDAVPEGASNLYFTAQRVRDTVLAALSTATNAAITAADTVLSALGKLQKQITDDIAALAAHTSAPDPHSQYTTQTEAAAAAPVQTVNGQTGNVTLALGTNNAAVTRSAPTASASTALTTIQSYPIAAGEIVAGSEYEFFASLRVINTTTVTNAVVTISVGATNVLVLTQAIGATAAAAPGAPVQIFGRISFASATQAECTLEFNRSTAVAANIILNTSAPITVSAAGATTLDLKFNTSGATSTFIARQSTIHKVK